MDDAYVELILRGMGITPSDPNYATYASALKSRAQAESNVQGRWFAEDTRRFDATLQNQKRQLDNQYKAAMAGVKNDRERIKLDRWKAQEDVRLTEARIAIEQGNLEVAKERLGIDRGAQGLDLLRTTVELNQQPRSWSAALDWRQGVRANPDAPVFLRSLLDNTASRVGVVPQMAAAPGLPEQNSLAATLSGLGVNTAGNAVTDQAGGSGNTAASGQAKDVDPRVAAINAVAKNYTPSDGDAYDAKDIQALKTIAAIAAQGTGKTANRTAMLDEDEQQFLAGGMDRLGIGGDWWLRDSERKRYGGGIHSGTAA